MRQIANSTLLTRLTYASPAWWGLIGSEGLLRLKSVVSRAVKQGFLPPNQPALDEICDKYDVGLFDAIMDDRNHALNHLLSPVKNGVYNLCQRNHNRIIPDIKDSLFSKNIYYPHDFPTLILGNSLLGTHFLIQFRF